MATQTLPWPTPGKNILSIPKRASQPMIERITILLLKVLVTILLAFSMGWAWFAFLASREVFGAVLFKLTVDVGVGLWAGVAARAILRGKTRLLGWCTALISTFICLPVLSMISRGRAGFDPLQYSVNGANWDGLGQIVLCGFIAWLPVSAWRRRPARFQKSEMAAPLVQSMASPVALSLPEPAPLKTQLSVPQVQPAPRSGSKQVARKKMASTPAGANGAVRTRSKVQPKKSAKVQSGISGLFTTVPASLKVKGPSAPVRVRRSSTSGQEHPECSKAGKKGAEPASGAAGLRLSRARRRAPVKLVGETEHRCPYCLEEMNPNDPAGVMICPVCHSYHHKACWDITGTCQVPHKQDL